MLMKIETELLKQLEREIRDVTREYIQLRKHQFKASGGSRTLMLLNRVGSKETAVRLIARSSSDGLKFLHSIGRLDLAIETIVLKDEYAPLFEDKQYVLTRARAHLEAITDLDERLA